MFNLAGLGIPLVVALITIPQLISSLGTEKFGILTLIWAIVSYFGLFDMGLGRSLTLLLSRKLAADDKDISSLVWTALGIMLLLGLAAGLLLSGFSFLWVHKLAGSIDQQDLFLSIFIMSVAIPFVILTAGYRGVLEASGSFLFVNIIRLPMGVYTFLAPLLVVYWWGPDLYKISIILLIGRILAFIPHVLIAHHVLPDFKYSIQFRRKYVKPLFSVGGWITVSNIVSPFMGYLDRFLIGFILGASAVAYYATPNEMITKIWIIPGAITSVIFPRLVQEIATNNERVKKTLLLAVSLVFILVFPIVLVLYIYSYEILEVWLSSDFAENSSNILQVFCIGIMVNCLSHIPFTYIQSTGNTRLTAYIHIFQLPIFCIVLLWSINQFGLIGAAYAWMFRLLVDAFLMWFYAYNIYTASVR